MQLGIIESQGAGNPGNAVDYVLANPVGQAVLRPLRYPLYDSEKFTNNQTAQRTLFTDHKKFQDGSAKTECDTNMTLDSQIGHPNLFDLVGFSGELDWGVNQNDFNDFYTKNTFRWVFGANTVFTRIVLKKIPAGIAPYGFPAIGGGAIITAGLPSGREFYNFCTPDRKARRIDSVEQFRNEIQPCQALAMTASGRKWTTYMLGIYYSSL